MSANEKIADTLVSHDLRVERAITGERRRVARHIDDMIDELSSVLARHYKGGPSPAVAKRQIQRIDEAARTFLIDSYRDIAVEHHATRRRMAALESLNLAETVNTASGFTVMAAKLTGAQITALLDEAVVEGAPARQWWTRQTARMRNAYLDQVRQGMRNAETLDQVVRRVRGPVVKEAFKRQAEALVRTSMLSVNTQARLATIDANSNVVKGVQQVSTLDDRTSEICIAYSGLAWSLPDYKPMGGHSLPWNGGPPRHFNCRSRTVPVLKSWEEMANVRLAPGGKNPRQKLETRFRANLKAENFTKKQIDRARLNAQSSLDGDVAENLNFGQWLRGKSEPFQRRTLGAGRYELWKEGRLSTRDLVNQTTGRPLSMEQLERKFG